MKDYRIPIRSMNQFDLYSKRELMRQTPVPMVKNNNRIQSFSKGDLISFSEGERENPKLMGTITHIWNSRNSLNVRVLGRNKAVEVELNKAEKVI